MARHPLASIPKYILGWSVNIVNPSARSMVFRRPKNTFARSVEHRYMAHKFAWRTVVSMASSEWDDDYLYDRLYITDGPTSNRASLVRLRCWKLTTYLWLKPWFFYFSLHLSYWSQLNKSQNTDGRVRCVQRIYNYRGDAYNTRKFHFITCREFFSV